MQNISGIWTNSGTKFEIGGDSSKTPGPFFVPPALGYGDNPRGSAINNRAIFLTLCVSFVLYSAYVYTAGTAAAHIPPMSDEGRHGQQLFQEHNCIACHQFYGLGGYMGPDLTNVVSNRGPAYTRAFLMGGTAQMPDFDLADEEISALVAYLEFVDKTGRYPAEDIEIRWFGTVTQADDPR